MTGAPDDRPVNSDDRLRALEAQLLPAKTDDGEISFLDAGEWCSPPEVPFSHGDNPFSLLTEKDHKQLAEERDRRSRNAPAIGGPLIPPGVLLWHQIRGG